MHDVDRDGCADLVMVRGGYPLGDEAPFIYRNNGSGQFQALSPEAPLAGAGLNIVPADLNGDGVIDFVYPHHDNGPDNRYHTADDFVTFVAYLNTTPPGPVRCDGMLSLTTDEITLRSPDDTVEIRTRVMAWESRADTPGVMTGTVAVQYSSDMLSGNPVVEGCLEADNITRECSWWRRRAGGVGSSGRSVNADMRRGLLFGMGPAR